MCRRSGISTTKLINIYLPHTTQHSYGLSYGNNIRFIVPVASGRKILSERTQFNLCYNRENFRIQLFLGVTKSSHSAPSEREYWHSHITFSCSVLRSGQQLRNGRADHELDSYQLVSFLGG